MDVQHHAMHDAYERVVKPEVGGEGDDACVGHALAKYSQRAPESSGADNDAPPTSSHAQDQPWFLPYIYISRAGGNLHFGAAATHRPFQFVSAQRALHGDWQIGVNRTRAGMHIQIEPAARADCQPSGA